MLIDKAPCAFLGILTDTDHDGIEVVEDGRLRYRISECARFLRAVR